MDLAIVVSALVLGLAGTPHCLAMCAAPCAMAVGGGGRPALGAFHLMRIAGYALAGALAASSVNALGTLAQMSPALRPLWTLLHAAAIALGLWLALMGRQPQWLENLGRRVHRPAALSGGWQAVQGPLRAGGIGALWVAWPCGLLQSALVAAALAPTAAGGAAAMAAFGMATAAGLMFGPALWHRLAARGGGSASVAVGTLGVRLAGVLLAAASGWALWRGLWGPGGAYCVS